LKKKCTSLGVNRKSRDGRLATISGGIIGRMEVLSRVKLEAGNLLWWLDNPYPGEPDI
jgi:hypothetical protein